MPKNFLELSVEDERRKRFIKASKENMTELFNTDRDLGEYIMYLKNSSTIDFKVSVRGKTSFKKIDGNIGGVFKGLLAQRRLESGIVEGLGQVYVKFDYKLNEALLASDFYIDLGENFSKYIKGYIRQFGDFCIFVINSLVPKREDRIELFTEKAVAKYGLSILDTGISTPGHVVETITFNGSARKILLHDLSTGGLAFFMDDTYLSDPLFKDFIEGKDTRQELVRLRRNKLLVVEIQKRFQKKINTPHGPIYMIGCTFVNIDDASKSVIDDFIEINARNFFKIYASDSKSVSGKTAKIAKSINPDELIRLKEVSNNPPINLLKDPNSVSANAFMIARRELLDNIKSNGSKVADTFFVINGKDELLIKFFFQGRGINIKVKMNKSKNNWAILNTFGGFYLDFVGDITPLKDYLDQEIILEIPGYDKFINGKLVFSERNDKAMFFINLNDSFARKRNDRIDCISDSTIMTNGSILTKENVRRNELLHDCVFYKSTDKLVIKDISEGGISFVVGESEMKLNIASLINFVNGDGRIHISIKMYGKDVDFKLQRMHIKQINTDKGVVYVLGTRFLGLDAFRKNLLSRYMIELGEKVVKIGLLKTEDCILSFCGFDNCRVCPKMKNNTIKDGEFSGNFAPKTIQEPVSKPLAVMERKKGESEFK